MSYDLKRIYAPRLSGAALLSATALMENRLFGPLMAKSFFKTLEIDLFRKLRFKSKPLLYPAIDPPPGEPQADAPLPLDQLTAERFGASAHQVSAENGAFVYRSTFDYARAYRDGSLSPVTVAERIIHVLDYQDRGDPPLYAFINWNKADIRAMAAESAERIKAGTARSVLEGVPVSVKDFLDQIGYPTTLGTSFLTDKIAERDAFIVQRLRDAGALLIGKTNMHEVGLGVTGLNPFYGTPVNPYAPWRYPGGSSSGSASAVASGLCVGSVGGDGGGSIRIPAAFCGVYGLKPTFGRLSDAGAYPLGWSVAQSGPIAATARDLALMYAVMAGPNPAERSSKRQPAVCIEGLQDGVRGLRIGVYSAWFDDCKTEVATACHAALNRLVDAGAEIVPIDIPELNNVRLAHLISIAAEIAAVLDRYREDHRTDFSIDTRANVALAKQLSPSDYIKAQQARARALRHFGAVFETVDVIATPTSAVLPPAVPKDRLLSGESHVGRMTAMMRYVAAANLLGYPAVSVPAGFVTARSKRFWLTIEEHDEDGNVYSQVPVGLQFMARHWDEHTLLRVAYATEAALERPKPRVYLAPFEAHNPLVPGYAKPVND